MARKARTHFAILGLLCWKPMSGYDIKKMVDVALTYFWSESYGQIFPVLNRLVEAGLATKQQDPASGGRRRQVYSVTKPLLRDEMKLKFFLSSRATVADGVRLLEEHLVQQQEHLEMLRESELILAAAIKQEGLPAELSELANTLGWDDKPVGDRTNAYELLVFYLTLLAIEISRSKRRRRLHPTRQWRTDNADHINRKHQERRTTPGKACAHAA